MLISKAPFCLISFFHFFFLGATFSGCLFLVSFNIFSMLSFSASFSGGSSSGGNKEILVQHLLVKEDDLKLLVELMKRVAQGWYLNET